MLSRLMDPPVVAPLKELLEKQRRDIPMFLALLFLSFLPVSYCMSAIADQKFNQLYLQGYQPLQNHPGDCYEGPH
jgi:hypothetical protein